MRNICGASLLVLLALASTAAGQGPAIDWEKEKAEILQHYRALVQVNTTYGNETKVVDYLKKVLDAEGIPSKTFAKDPTRANLVARLKGNGSKRPLLILAHTDVVAVQTEKWPVDPFGAVMKDGYIWGRGTIDDKDKLVTMLMTFVLMKRSGAVLDRDLIFLAESGEEADPTGVGINFMVNQHFDEIDAEFALTEGGTAKLENGRVTVVQVGTTEKVPRRARLVATGTSGHGSVPRTVLCHASIIPLCILAQPLGKSGHGRPRCISMKLPEPTSRDWQPSVLQTKRHATEPFSIRRARSRFSVISQKTSQPCIRRYALRLCLRCSTPASDPM